MVSARKETSLPKGLLRWVVYFCCLFILAYFYYWRNAGYSVDDSYITYRYAFNLKEGHGLVFNPGEHYYGTTAAGYAVLLAALALFFQSVGELFGVARLAAIDVPQIAVLVSTVSLACIGVLGALLVRLQQSVVRWMVCIGAVAVLFLSHPFNEVAGHETYAFLAALLGGAFLFLSSRRPLAAAVAFAIATSFRPDAILGPAVVVFVDWRFSGLGIGTYLQSRRFRQFVATYALLMVVWLAFLALYFGTPLPGTMAAKKAQVALGYWPRYSVPVLGAYIMSTLGFLGAAFVGLGLLFLALALAARDPNAESCSKGAVATLVSMGAFGVMAASGYLLLNVTFWQWYGVPIVFSVLSAGLAGWILVLDRVEVLSQRVWMRDKLVSAALVGAPILVLSLLAGATLRVSRSWATTRNVNEHIHAYTEIADFIKAEAPDGAVIQMFEPGAFGYRLGPRYKVVDELGLITPGVAQALKRGDKTFLLDSSKPDYLVCSWKGSYSICDTELMTARFELVGSFNESFWQPRIGEGARLYRAVNDDHRDDTRPVMERVKSIVLGDRWGLVKPTEDRNVLFVHPGQSSETSFDYECKGTCENIMMSARIADLPKEAGPEAGNVAIDVSNGSGTARHVIVSRQASLPLGRIGIGVNGRLHFSVTNNGDSSFDWLLLTLRDARPVANRAWKIGDGH